MRRVEGDADELVVAALAHVAHEDLVRVRGRVRGRVGVSSDPNDQAVPRDDHVWLRRRGHSRVVDNDDWGFVGNDKDPGLLF